MKFLTTNFTYTSKLFLIFKNLNGKKSSDIAWISNAILRHFPPHYIFLHAFLFNDLLSQCLFSNCWKIAKLIPILKKNENNSDPVSYRLINLLTRMSKSFEKIINSSILYHCYSLHALPNQQFKSAILTLIPDICWWRIADHWSGLCSLIWKKRSA
jgi:hypothetical protein